jgi:hypothetical protein
MLNVIKKLFIFNEVKRKEGLKEKRLKEILEDRYKSEILMLSETDPIIKVAIDSYLNSEYITWEMTLISLVKTFKFAKDFYSDRESSLFLSKRLKRVQEDYKIDMLLGKE